LTEKYAILKSNDLLKHEKFGTGRVEYDKGETVIVRFEHGIEECEKVSLTLILSPTEALDLLEWHRPLEVIARAQAEAIRSLNDALRCCPINCGSAKGFWKTGRLAGWSRTMLGLGRQSKQA
jgi:hypothetical protein